MRKCVTKSYMTQSRLSFLETSYEKLVTVEEKINLDLSESLVKDNSRPTIPTHSEMRGRELFIWTRVALKNQCTGAGRISGWYSGGL